MYQPPGRLPNFFLVGAPKTGTTSLCNYLRQHPEIYISPVKEPCFFACEMRSEKFSPAFADLARRSSRNLLKYIDGPMSDPNPGGIVSDGNAYLKLFKNVGAEKAIGEASVCYLWSPTAPAKIRAQVPEAKIVVILRDPVERAFSQYLQYAASGLLKTTFRQHIELCLRNTDPALGPLRPFLEYGLYYQQVKRYLDAFSPARVRIYIYEEAWQSPSRFLHDLFCFLGVDAQVHVDTSIKDLERRGPKSMPLHYALRKSGLTPAMKKFLPAPFQISLRSALFKRKPLIQLAPKDRQYTMEYYCADIQKLSGLLGRDLSAWLT
jgi:Sulfotransferase family